MACPSGAFLTSHRFYWGTVTKNAFDGLTCGRALNSNCYYFHKFFMKSCDDFQQMLNYTSRIESDTNEA